MPNGVSVKASRNADGNYRIDKAYASEVDGFKLEASQHVHVMSIYRKSLEEGILPKDWRMAVVIPIFKKGNKHEASNYRPVSLTSVPCKV